MHGRNNIKMNLKYIECGGISRIAAAHNWAQCWVLLNIAMYIRFSHRSWQFLLSSVTKGLLKRSLHHIIGYNDVHACTHRRFFFPKDVKLILDFRKE